MAASLEEVRRVYAEAERLYGPDEVEAALDRMAADIAARFGDRAFVMLCVMIGGMVPGGQLLPRLRGPFQVDYCHATRYREATRGQATVEWRSRPSVSLAGREVLVVDDILDEGGTLEAVTAYCREAGAASVHSAVLVDKATARRRPGISADIHGLRVGDRYVFGYGMDYKGYLRNAPGIFAVTDG